MVTLFGDHLIGAAAEPVAWTAVIVAVVTVVGTVISKAVRPPRVKASVTEEWQHLYHELRDQLARAEAKASRADAEIEELHRERVALLSRLTQTEWELAETKALVKMLQRQLNGALAEMRGLSAEDGDDASSPD